MAKSKKQRMMEARDKRDARKILRIVLICTVVLCVLTWFMFSRS